MTAQCIYPKCNCPFDMGPDNKCLRGYENKRENIHCRPGVTDAMERLAAENEQLKAELLAAQKRAADSADEVARLIASQVKNKEESILWVFDRSDKFKSLSGREMAEGSK